MKSNLVAAPEFLPVAFEEVKSFLRVDQNDDDQLIESLILAATKRLEALSDLKFVTQTWDVFFDEWPHSYNKKDKWWEGVRDGAISDLYSPCNEISLPFGKLQSVISIDTFSDSDVSTAITFDPTQYFADTESLVPEIKLMMGATWPTTVLRPLNGIRIRGVYGFGAGYDPDLETPSEVPKDIQSAIKNLVAVMYEHRGDELPKIPASVMLLIEPYRRIKVGRI